MRKKKKLPFLGADHAGYMDGFIGTVEIGGQQSTDLIFEDYIDFLAGPMTNLHILQDSYLT